MTCLTPSQCLPVVTVVEGPAPIVSLARAKAHMRVEHSDDDPLIEGFLAAATAMVDGPTGGPGKTVGEQTLELSVNGFCGAWLQLPHPPVSAIVQVAYDDADGEEVLLDETTYTLRNGGVAFLSGAAPRGPSGLRVRYVAGFPWTADDPPVWTGPATAEIAILLIAADFYENREGQIAQVGLIQFAENRAVQALLQPLKIYTV